MVLGVCHVFLGIFMNFSLQHFRFSVAFSPFFGLFGLLKAFSPHSCLRHFVQGKKSKSGLLQAKKTQKRASGNRKKEMLQASVQKNAPKNTTHPQNHISVHFYFLSNKRQRYIPFFGYKQILGGQFFST